MAAMVNSLTVTKHLIKTTRVKILNSTDLPYVNGPIRLFCVFILLLDNIDTKVANAHSLVVAKFGNND